MRIDVQWLSEEKRVIHIVYHANWDWDDFQEHRMRAKELSRAISYNISLLIEYDNDAVLLPNNALRNLSVAAENAQSNVGLVIMVAPSQFWRVVLVLLKRLLPNSPLKDSHIVKTREEGLALLRDYLGESTN
jgi:hypothetical protein